MTNKFDKLFEKSRQVSLTDLERASLRHILRAAAQVPVREAAPARPMFVPMFTFARTMPIILIVIILAGGGVSFAAENALPGDSLYALKLDVNERVRGWAALSPEAEANWQVRRAERRLDEAVVLAANGKLNAEAAAQVQANFEDHVQAVARNILALNADEGFQAAAGVTSDFETSLEAHEKIFRGIQSKNEIAAEAKLQAMFAADTTAGDKDTEIAKFISKLKTRSKSVAKTRVDIEARIAGQAKADVQVAAQARHKEAEKKLAEAVEHVKKMKQMLGANAVVQAEARLELARQAVLEGKAKLEAGFYAEAFSFFQKAHRIAQEAKLLIEAQRKFKIDIRLNSSAAVTASPEPEKTEIKLDAKGHIELEI